MSICGSHPQFPISYRYQSTFSYFLINFGTVGQFFSIFSVLSAVFLGLWFHPSIFKSLILLIGKILSLFSQIKQLNYSALFACQWLVLHFDLTSHRADDFFICHCCATLVSLIFRLCGNNDESIFKLPINDFAVFGHRSLIFIVILFWDPVNSTVVLEIGIYMSS